MKVIFDDEMKELIRLGIVDISQVDYGDDEEYTPEDWPFDDICPGCAVRYVHDFPACLERCPYANS